MFNPARLFHEKEKIIYRDVKTEMEKSFLDYSMSVIVSRALPDVRDGLKPVHRRILFCQYKKGLTYDKPYHKCADTVGSVLGEFHPHGDASVYDALVRLAQDFSLRYPVVDGHGNFGSVDGDPPAAYRYTEARLSKISNEMLRDINKNTVDWQANFDDRLEEPTVLPSRFPNLLVNGSMGIAVGMATNIPPHNLSDTILAVKKLIEDRKINEDTDIASLIKIIKAPDFPTGGIIMGQAGVNAAYRTGRGRIIVRGKAEVEDFKNTTRIVITEIPYMVNKRDLVTKIGVLIKEKRLEGATEIRDETGRAGMKIIVDLKRGVDGEVVLNQLYRFTDLQNSFGANMVALVGGVPRTITLKEALVKYLDFQEQVVFRRTQFELNKIEKRLHILKGLLLAIDNIDEVISILRASKNVPEGKARLVERFAEVDLSNLLARAINVDETEFLAEPKGLSPEQSDAIVAMTFGQLTGLEREKVEKESTELFITSKELKEILADRIKLLDVVSEELTDISKKYGDERRTELSDLPGEVEIEDLINVEQCIVTFTALGYLKRQSPEDYKAQKRGGRGVFGVKKREEDFAVEILSASTHDNLLFFTNFGNIYKLKGYEIPDGSKQTKGINIVNVLGLLQNEKVVSMTVTNDFSAEKSLFLVTKNGLIKRTALNLYKNIKSKRPLRAIVIREGDEIKSAFVSDGKGTILVASKNGRAVRFNADKLRIMGRICSGVKAMRIDSSENNEVVGTSEMKENEGAFVLTVSEKGFARFTPAESYPIKGRGVKGVVNYKPADDRGCVAGIAVIDDPENTDILFISSNGVVIRVYAADLVVHFNRAGKGVRVMRLGEGDSKVVSFTLLEHDDSEEITKIEVAPEEISDDEEISEDEENDDDEGNSEDGENDDDGGNSEDGENDDDGGNSEDGEISK